MNKITKNKTFFIIAILILISVGIYFIFLNNKNTETIPKDEIIVKPEEFIKEAPVNPDNITKTYKNFQYGFSFDYPKEFKIVESGEETKTILINDANGNFQFQIIVNLFDEPGPLTRQRILQDLPDLKMEGLQEKKLQNGNSVLIFLTNNSSLGKVREVWFIYNEYLYQISALQEFDNKLNEILSTWKFQN